ncbi:unnamed protein product [Gongylonema pulchrum]|uniref:Acyl carrier protein n=1 Tax=Gongylonema pulchrum TaxID=637853 RepID=A0A183EGX7_9BILA|nr:unnamed protein product [Gongylonema pulchrum]
MSMKAVFNKTFARSATAVACFSRQMQPVFRPKLIVTPLYFESSRNFRVCNPCLSTGTVQEIGPFTPPKQLTFEEVEQRVMKAIRAWDRFPEDKKEALTLDSHFVNDMGFDSLDHVEIVMSLEDEFGFEIPDTDAEKLETPRDIFQYVCEHEDVFE